jgi:CRP/FNR family transcriptional regulator, cyclic AMP receptor protein
MDGGELGKVFQNADVIVGQGEKGNCMYVIQSGQAEVIQALEGKEVRLAVLGENEFFGEMAIFDHEVRSATVRALGEVRVLTVDKRTLLRRIQEDPALTFRIVEHICNRLRKVNAELVRLKTGT